MKMCDFESFPLNFVGFHRMGGRFFLGETDTTTEFMK